MTTTDELRQRLDALRSEHDRIYDALTSMGTDGPVAAMRWRDTDLAEFLACDLDSVRGWIVRHLVEFDVSDDCDVALLDLTQLAAIMNSLKSPRVADLDFVDAQIALITSRLQFCT